MSPRPSWTEESRFATWYPRIVVLVDLIGKAIGEPMAPESGAALLCIKRGIDAANLDLLFARERGPLYWSRLSASARVRIALNAAALAIAGHLLAQASPHHVPSLRLKLAAFLECAGLNACEATEPSVTPPQKVADPDIDGAGAPGGAA